MWQKAWFRWSVRAVALVALAALAAVFALRWQGERALRDARREFTRKVGPLNPEAYRSKPVAAKEENGAVWLAAGARAVVIFPPEGQGLRALAQTPSCQWSQAQVQLARRLLERNAPSLVLLHRALGQKVCDLGDAVTGKTDYLLSFVAAARLLAADCRDALRQGEMDRFFASAETLRLLASAQERQAELLDLLLGSSIERLLLPVLQEAACATSLPPGDMDRLGSLLPAADLTAALRRAAGYEASAMMERIDEGTAAEYLGIQLGVAGHLINWIRRDADCARALAGWTAWVESMDQPYGQRLGPSPGRQPASNDPYAMDKEGKTRGRLQATLALRQLAALGLAVRKAGLERGAYPAALSAFPGAGSPDPFTGKPLAYTLHPDGSATLALAGGGALYGRLTAGKSAPLQDTWALPPLGPPRTVPTRGGGQSGRDRNRSPRSVRVPLPQVEQRVASPDRRGD